MKSVPAAPRFPRDNSANSSTFPFSDGLEKHPYDRPGDPEKPSVVKIGGEWWAQLCNSDEFPEGYMCRNGKTQQEAFGKVPELIAALAKRKQGGGSE